jgi:hypothetical protein
MWKIASILALLVVAVLAGWLLLGDEAVYDELGGPDSVAPQEPLPPPLPIEPAPPAAAALPAAADEALPPLPEVPEWILPSLNQSDAFVRERLAEMGVPERWGSQDELVRRLAGVVENASRGEYPRRQLAYLALARPFAVVERDGRMYVDPANYARYDGLLTALEAVDPRALARLLDFLLPLVDESLVELDATGSARAMLAAGLRWILDVPVLVEPPELARPNVFHVYADPALEQLRPLQKLVLRSGPDNVVRVQAYARQLASAMNLTPVPVAP